MLNPSAIIALTRKNALMTKRYDQELIMKNQIVICVLLLTASVYAQSDSLWSRTYGSPAVDNAYAALQTADGGYIIAGSTEYGAGYTDAYLVKANASGNQEWTRTFGGIYTDEAYSVEPTSDGGYVLAGRTLSFGAGSYDFYLVKTGANGEAQWSRTFGGVSIDRAESVKQTADGGYIIAGTTNSYGAGSDDFFLVKTDPNGIQEWTRTYGGNSADRAQSVMQTTDGGYVLAGTTYSFGNGSGDCYLIKTNNNGDTLWTRTFGGSARDESYIVQQTNDGGYVLAGRTLSFGAGNYDFYLVKADADGNQQWTRTFGGSNLDWAYSVRQTADGGYVLAGYTQSFGAGYDDFYIVKTDASGIQLWQRTFGGLQQERANSIIQTFDFGYAIVGWTTSFGPGAPTYSNMWFVKTSPDGPLPEAGQLTGDVRNEGGQALDSVRIVVQGRVDTTDANGSYFIDNLYPGYSSVSATRRGFITSNDNVTIAAGSTTSHNITLHDEGILVVNVRDVYANPVAGALLQTIGSTDVYATTNASGLCSLRVRQGTYDLRVSKSGFTDQYVRWITINDLASRYVVLVRPQVQVPTYVLLIRGISPLPQIFPDTGNWEDFISAFSARYSSESNMHCEAVVIAPDASVHSNAARLYQHIQANIPSDPSLRIILVGHSMGGIIARYYLAATHDDRVDRIFTIDSPHAGSSWAETANNIWNINCHLWPWLFDCYEAYEDISPLGMISLNSRMLPEERNLSTTYYIISSSVGVATGDGIVSLPSQLGMYLPPFEWFFRDLFEDFRNHDQRIIRRLPPFGRHQHCVGPTHICQTYDPDIIEYILDNLSSFSEDVPSRQEDISLDAGSDPQTVLRRTELLYEAQPYSYSISISASPYIRVNTIGLTSTSAWELVAPDETVYNDSISFINAGGELVYDSSGSYIMGILPSPEPGVWNLQMELIGIDSSFVAFSIDAPMPVRLVPKYPRVVAQPGLSILTSAQVAVVSGVAVDSVTARIYGDTTFFNLNDSGQDGDEVVGDDIWSATPFVPTETGECMVDFVAYAHAGTEQYRVQSSINYSVQYIIATISGVGTWEPVDADSNDLDEQLHVPISISVDSAAQFQISAMLTDIAGDFITATHAEDSLETGIQSLSLAFDGKQIADQRLDGPFVLRDVRLNRLHNDGISTLEYHDSIAASPAFTYAQFEGRPGLVDNVGAVRSGSTMECFWTPHNDPDIAHFNVYYDTDGQPPYEGTGLAEGVSPVNAGNGLSFAFSGLDSSSSYTIAVTAVDSAGSESEYSLPYTVFALSAPNPVDDLTIMKSGDNHVLNWSSVPSGARYRIETAPSVDGPWTAVAITYSTSYERPIPALENVLFFRVIAER